MKIKKIQHNTQKGFNLLELMISISVMAILLALAAPNQAASIAASKIRTTSDSILAGLQSARSEAISRNIAVAFVIDPNTTGWQVINTNSNAILNQKSANENNFSFSITPTPSATTTVTFDGMGRTDNNIDGSVTLTQLVIANTTGQTAAKTLNIKIGAGGLAKICDPTVLDSTDVRAC